MAQDRTATKNKASTYMASIPKRNLKLSAFTPAELYEGKHDPMDIQSCYEHEQFLKQSFKEFNNGLDERHQFQALWMFWLCKYKPAQVGTELQNLSVAFLCPLPHNRAIGNTSGLMSKFNK